MDLTEKIISSEILKARHGRYEDNAENRRLHRVGQEYGKAAKEKEETTSTISALENKIAQMEKNKHVFLEQENGKMRYERALKTLKDKLAEKKGGRKGDEKLHDEAIERKDKEASKKEAKRSEKTDSDYESVNQKNRESKAQRDKNIEERLKTGWMEVGDGRVAKVVENLRDGSFIARFYDGKEEFDDKVSPGTRMYEALSSSEKFPKETLRKYRDYLQGVLSTTKSKVLYEYYKKEIAKTSEKIGEKSEEEKAREADVKKKTDKKESVKKEDTDSKPSEEKESEQVYTRVKFEDIPNSGKVNLKKYLSGKMKRSADEAWGDISRIDTEGLRKMERGMVEDFNRQFDDLPKSRRAEKLYAIMKVKGELAKRDKKKTMNDNDKQAAKDTLKEVRKNQSSVIKEAKSILDDAVGGKLKWGKTEAGTWGTLDNGENDHLLGDLSLELEKWGNLKIWDMVEGKVIKTFGSQSSMFEDSIKKFFKEQKGSGKADESLSEKKSSLQKELREMEQIHGLRERGKAWKDYDERVQYRKAMNEKQHEIDDIEKQLSKK